MLYLLGRGCRFVAVLAAVFVAGCGGGGGNNDSGGNTGPAVSTPAGWRSVRPLAQPAQKKWTVLVFVNAVNDLERYSGLNLNQMEQVGSTDQVNVVVQIKRFANKYDDSFADWKDTSTRRFYVTRDNTSARIGSILLQQNDDVDMGAAGTLQQFVQWGAANFPAQRYALVMWNHGAGWRSVKPGSPPGRGVSYDDQTGSHINTVGLPGAIQLPNGAKWDLVAWDASLMQMAEVAYEIRDQTRYIVGSEESPPGTGYPYHVFLAHLSQNPAIDGRQLGVDIAQTMLDANGTDSPITQSVLDASKLGFLAPTLDRLGSALLASQNLHAAGIAQARSLAENYGYPENRDLLDFADLLVSAPAGSATPRVSDAGVAAAVEQVRSAVNAALVTNVHGGSHPNSRGLAIFLPQPALYDAIDADQRNGFGQPYDELAFAKAAPNWLAFLRQGPP